MTTIVDQSDDIATRLARYRSVHDIDAHITDSGRIIVRAGHVGCIRIPADLGKLVVAELDRRDLATPVIVDDASTSWRFLTQRPASVPLFDPLFLSGGKQSGFGADISLPTPGRPERRWLVAPTGTKRLPSATVVDVALEQAHQRAKSQVGP